MGVCVSELEGEGMGAVFSGIYEAFADSWCVKAERVPFLSNLKF